jgi:hypothetical protein
VVPASAANVVVSEIHYHPLDPTADELAAGFNSSNDFEFIEIMNIGASAVDLTGCRFTNGVAFDWADAPADKRSLAPGARLVICENAAAFARRHGAAGLNVAGTFTGNLSNAGELIRLVDAASGDIKNFSYDDSPPWPADTDPATGAPLGHSLVLNYPSTNPNHAMAANWRSSAAVHGQPGLADGTAFAGSPLADTDGDGTVDIIEFATGSRIDQRDAARSPELSLGTHVENGVPAAYLQFSFTRSLSAEGVALVPELTSDLRAWSTNAIPITLAGSQLRGDGTVTETWRTTQPASALPGTVVARLRVQVVP